MEPSATAAHRIPQIGEILGRYRILEVIGRGSTGPVYRAWDESLTREVALKTLWPQYLAEGGVRSRFEREARAAARLESPFVVHVYDIGEADGIPYIAMEYISGGQIIADSAAARPMEWRRALEIVRDVAEGLALAHSLGIIHRDIKPANVMLGPQGRAKIADFGLARAIAEESHTVTTTGTLLGTPAYLAPEIIEGEAATPLSDIYSVGILLYRLVTGRLPFEGSSPAAVLRGHLEGSIARVSGRSASSDPGTEIPPSIDTIIAGCTARRPEARYAAVDLVRQDLEDALEGRTPTGAQPQTISSDLPFWARYLPGAERTVMEVREETGRARRRLEEAQKQLRESEISARELESSAEEAEKNAFGWRIVAERVLEEGKEDETREALGYAGDYDNHAKAYRDELARHQEMLADLRRQVAEIKSATDDTEVRGSILLSRRRLAKMILGETVKRRPAALLAAGTIVVLIAVIAASKPKTTAVIKVPPSLIETSTTIPAQTNPMHGVGFTEILSGTQDWQPGHVYYPNIWSENGSLQMVYSGGSSVMRTGFASSIDGTHWNRSILPPLSLPSDGEGLTTSCYIPEKEILMSNVWGGRNKGIYAWRRGGGGRFDAIGYVIPLPPGSTANEPGNVVKIDGKWMIFTQHVTESGGAQSKIARAESDDGVSWTNFQTVLEPSGPFVNGPLSCPYVFQDSESGEWTMWYLAARGWTISETVLCRAKSKDGLHFDKPEVFLRPESLQSDIQKFGNACEVVTPSGAFLYIAAYNSAGTARIIRLDIPNPHTAPAVG